MTAKEFLQDQHPEQETLTAAQVENLLTEYYKFKLTGKQNNTEYTTDEKDLLFTAILERIANCEPVREILKAKEMPAIATFFKWISSNSDYMKRYAHALKLREMSIFAEMLAIADDKTVDPKNKRVMVDTRKWVLGKMNPEIYGEKQTMLISGRVDNVLIELTAEERTQRINELLTKANQLQPATIDISHTEPQQ